MPTGRISGARRLQGTFGPDHGLRQRPPGGPPGRQRPRGTHQQPARAPARANGAGANKGIQPASASGPSSQRPRSSCHTWRWPGRRTGRSVPDAAPLAARLGGHSRQADNLRPSDDNGREAVTDRDLNMSANRRYGRTRFRVGHQRWPPRMGHSASCLMPPGLCPARAGSAECTHCEVHRYSRQGG